MTHGSVRHWFAKFFYCSTLQTDVFEVLVWMQLFSYCEHERFHGKRNLHISVFFSDIWSSYSGYPKKQFLISEKSILDIIITLYNFSGYPKQFHIPQITYWYIWKHFSDIQNKSSVPDIQNNYFWISRITILDIWKNWINTNSACHKV